MTLNKLTLVAQLFLIVACSVKSTEGSRESEPGNVSEATQVDAKLKFETISLPFAYDSTTSTQVPHAVVESGSSAAAEEINKVLLDYLMIDSFDPKTAGAVNWSDMEFKHDEKDGTIWLSVTAAYNGPYSTYSTKDFFFDAATGQALPQPRLPYHALFSLEGFHKFMHENWLHDCTSAIQEANACAEMEASCNCYDVFFELKKDALKLNLTDNCFPHVALTCAPDHSVTFSSDSFQPHLSDFGKQVVSSDYANGNKLDQFLYYQKNRERIPDYVFVKGLINDKYPFSMALSFMPASREVTGSYYYDRHQQKIRLVGNYDYLKMTVDELSNNEVNGTFIFNYSNEYVVNGAMVDDGYLTATWSKKGSAEAMPVTLQAVLFNKDVNVYLGAR